MDIEFKNVFGLVVLLILFIMYINMQWADKEKLQNKIAKLEGKLETYQNKNNEVVKSKKEKKPEVPEFVD